MISILHDCYSGPITTAGLMFFAHLDRRAGALDADPPDPLPRSSYFSSRPGRA